MATGTDWIDVTRPIETGMVVYEGDPPVRVTPFLALERGDPAEVHALALGSHTGTHVDAPRHFLAGTGGVDRAPLDALMGPARVIAWPAGEVSPAAVAPAVREGARRVLLRTGNSSLWSRGLFVRDYQALGIEAAEALVAAGVRLVGHRLPVGGGVREHGLPRPPVPARSGRRHLWRASTWRRPSPAGTTWSACP